MVPKHVFDTSKLISFILFFGTLLVFATNAYTNNRSGHYTLPVCDESNGAPESSGDAECYKGNLESVKESRLRSATRGIANGFVPAIVMYLIGAAAGSKYDEYVLKRHEQEET